MTIPIVSINQVQPYYGRGDASAKPNAHYLKVWTGWDSPRSKKSQVRKLSVNECSRMN